MNNRFWGVWKAGEANTLILSSLGSASRVTLSFSCLFFFFQSLALLAPLCADPQPLCVPWAHQAHSLWTLSRRVVLGVRSPLTEWALNPSRCLLALLLPPPPVFCSSASVLAGCLLLCKQDWSHWTCLSSCCSLLE